MTLVKWQGNQPSGRRTKEGQGDWKFAVAFRFTIVNAPSPRSSYRLAGVWQLGKKVPAIILAA